MEEEFFNNLVEKIKVINPNKIVWFAFKAGDKKMLECKFDIIVVIDDLSKPHLSNVKGINHVYVMGLIKELHTQKPFLLLINTISDYLKFVQRTELIFENQRKSDIKILYERK